MKPQPRILRALILPLLALLALSAIWIIPLTHAQGQIQVSAADPASGAQGTVNLNVKVTGKGFKNGAKGQVVCDGNYRHRRRHG